MKKRLKKLLALAMSVTVALGTLTGCGSQKTATSETTNGGETSQSTTAEGKTYNGIDVSEHVELKMYLLGERTPDFDEVYAKVNEILEEKINCSISVDFLSWGEHDKKYSLLFSAQEKFDLIFTASSWGHYEQTVALGGFYPLSEDFIKTNAPQIWEMVPEIAWSQAKIGGEIYMVPNNQTEFGQDVLAVRGDLMKQFGMESISSWEELSEFYLACAENGIYAGQGGPWYQYFQSKGLSTVGGAPKGGELVLYNTQDPTDLSFTYLLDWDGFTEYCKEVKAMADAGCWSADVLNATDERQTGLLTGKTAAMIWNLGSCRTYAKQANKENPDWNVTLVDPVASQPKKANSYINNGVAINASSENKERAMMALNLFYTDPQVQDLTALGIEGKHWEAVGEDQYKVLDASGYGVDSNCNWGWKNDEVKRTEFIEERTTLDDTFDTMLEGFKSNQKGEHPYDGFNFDSTSVTTQLAAVEAALGNYYGPLTSGLVNDVEKSIEELKAALENAGIRDILAELEKQAAEHVAAN